MSKPKAAPIECDICEEIHREGLKAKGPQLTAAGKTVMAVGAGLAAVIYGITIPFIAPGFRRIVLPYVPATEIQISNIKSCLRGRRGSMIDLGSGDGRIVLSVMNSAASKESEVQIEKADGVELNRWLVYYSRLQRWKNRDTMDKSKIKFYKKDILKTNLGLYDNIVVFGVESLMEALESKLSEELGPDSIIVACRFPMPNWNPDFEFGEGIDKVWVYNRLSIPKGTPV